MNRTTYIQRPARTTLTQRIAAALSPELLGLRTRLLSRDIVSVYGVSVHTAYQAIGIARRAAR